MQISPRTGDLSPDIEEAVSQTLNDGGIEEFTFRNEDNRLLVILPDGESQAKAHGLIDLGHSDRNTTALNLVPATPEVAAQFCQANQSGARSARWRALSDGGGYCLCHSVG